MKFEVHLLSHDAERMLGWALRHYRSLACPGLEVMIVVHDGGPACVQKPLCDLYGAEHQFWDTAGQLNDELAQRLKNDCWRNAQADWVWIADADEMPYFPAGILPTLTAYDRMGAAVIKPHGFEMFSNEWHDADVFDEVSGVWVRKPEGSQVYDWCKMGAPDDKWYSKPVLFSPNRVAESGIGIGAHESRPVLRDGRAFRVGLQFPKANPATYLLHFHQLGPIGMVAARYDATRKRLAAVNVAHNWGNFEPGIDHAKRKRGFILAGLRQVVA